MSPELRVELDAAVDAYSRECERLIAAHERGELPKEWLADPHGEHCRFEHATSGQVVEAPFSWFVSPHFAIDPYFFGVFVKTGPGFPLLKKAIAHEFHDTLALLPSVSDLNRSARMIEFEHRHRARGPLGVYTALLATTLATAFIWSHDSFFPVFLGFGIGCAVLAFFSWRSVWKKDVWHLQIASGIMSWDYPKGSTDSSGSISMADISRVIVDDEQAQLRVTLKHGEEKKIGIAVSGYSLHCHLVSKHPHIPTEYISRQSSS